MQLVLPEKREGRRHNEEKGQERNAENEWVLCSEDWRDIVIMYVPELNDIPIEENYADISWEEIKKVYKQYKRKSQTKKNKQVK